MKKIITIIMLMFCTLSINAEGISVSITWNGSSASSVTPWGSNYSRGVDVNIINHTSFVITVKSIEVLLNNTSLGYLNISDTVIEPSYGKTYSFSITNTLTMPNKLPSVKITYEFCGIDWIFNTANNTIETGIDNIKYKNEDNKYYDLSGKLINNPIKGNIYIHNNKKIKY